MPGMDTGFVKQQGLLFRDMKATVSHQLKAVDGSGCPWGEVNGVKRGRRCTTV